MRCRSKIYICRQLKEKLDIFSKSWTVASDISSEKIKWICYKVEDFLMEMLNFKCILMTICCINIIKSHFSNFELKCVSTSTLLDALPVRCIPKVKYISNL